jgi:hypothetical protein
MELDRIAITGGRLTCLLLFAGLSLRCASDRPADSSPTDLPQGPAKTFVYVLTGLGGLAAYEADAEGGALRPIITYDVAAPYALAADPQGRFLALVTYFGSKQPSILNLYTIDPRSGQLSRSHSRPWHPEGKLGGMSGFAVTRGCIFVAGGLSLASYQVAGNGSFTLADARETPVGMGFEGLATDRAGRWLFSYFPRDERLVSWFVQPDCRLEDRPVIPVPTPGEGYYGSEIEIGDDLIVLSHHHDSGVTPPSRFRLQMLHFDATSGVTQPLGELFATSASGEAGLALGPQRLLAFGSRFYFRSGQSSADSDLRFYRIDEAGQARVLGSEPVSGARVFHAPRNQFFVADPFDDNIYGYRVDEAGGLTMFARAAVGGGLAGAFGLADKHLVAVTAR